MECPSVLINQFQNRLRTAAALLIAVAVLAASGCGRREAEPPPKPKLNVTIAPAPAPPALSVVHSQDGPTSLVLTLRWPAGAPDPESLPALVFCLPENQSVRGRFIDARVGGQPVARGTAAQPTPAGTFLTQSLQVDSAGYLRRWPLYRLNLPITIFELMRGQDGNRNKDIDLVLELSWSAGPAAPAFKLPDSQAERYWRRMAEAIVLNPAGLDRYVSAAPATPAGLTFEPTDPRALVPGNTPWARVRISRDGVYRITRDDLIRAGFGSAEADLAAVRLFTHGKPAPVIRDPEGLAPGLYFWAAAGTGPYSHESIYWITLAPKADEPVLKTIAHPPGELSDQRFVRRHFRLDRDNELVTLHGRFLAIEAIRWVDTILTRSADVPVPIDLPDYVPDTAPMRANFEFLIDRELATLQPRVEVRAGNHLLGTLTISNFDEPRGTVEIPASALTDGRTTMTLRMMIQQAGVPTEETQESGLWLDRVDIDYTGRAQLADGRLTLVDDLASSSPVWTALDRLTMLAVSVDDRGAAIGLPAIKRDGMRSMVLRRRNDRRVELFSAEAIEQIPSPERADLDNLGATTEGADLLIVTHKEFIDEARRLARYHESKGWRVRIADIQSVYDSFSHGEFTPLAIRRMLAYALRTWQGGAPAAVLLVGDCNSDYLDDVRQGVRNWVPTYTFAYSGDNWASDYWFTTVAGEDDLGDVIIGRLPVVDNKDLKTIVNKLIAYDTTPAAGPWRSTFGWVADDGEFPEVVDALRRNSTPPAIEARRVFLSEKPLEDNWYLPKSMVERKRMKVSRDATTSILDAFRRGVVYMTYYGHGSPNIWADERIWFGGDSHNSDNLQLAGTGRPAFVACMTCNSGAIDFPEKPWNICIMEDMLRVPDGGAVGCFVPSGPGITYIHRQMSEALARVLFTDKLRGMGEITQLAKLRYALAAQPRELVFMYHLLGDPLVNLQMISDWAKLDINPNAIAPGSRAEVAIEKIPIQTGKWLAELVRGDESVIWRSEGALDQGRAAMTLDCPTTATGCEATLRVRAWDDKQGWAAAGPLAVARPYLTLKDLRVTSSGAVATLTNPGKLAASGELSVIAWDENGTRSLGSKAVTLDAGTSAAQTFAISNSSGPAFYEARLNLPHDPDDPSLSRAMSVTSPLWQRHSSLVGSLPRWLKGSLRIERDNPAHDARLIAWASCDTTPTASLVTRDGRAVSTTTLTAITRLPAGIKQAQFTVNRALLDRLTSGTLKMNGMIDSPAVIPLKDARVIQPRLRIVPGSVSWHPRRPTVGQTVFVSCEVENIGTAASDPCGIEMRKGSALLAGESLPDAMGSSRRDVPRLAPGRRVRVEMRWDPHENAGPNKIQVRLDSGGGNAVENADQMVAVEITGLTKASFKVTKTWAEAARADLLANRINFYADVANNGETDARRVMVSFYRDEKQSPETEVGQIELDRVPGSATTKAQFVWNFKPGKDYTEGQPLPKPSVRVWLRGSSQRFSSTVGDID